jgi:hypothetical protein
MWIRAGIEAYGVALDLRDQHLLAATVSLGFSLEPGNSPRGVAFAEAAELSALMDWSPPSLYLFSVRILDAAQLFGSEVRGVAYFMKFLQSASDALDLPASPVVIDPGYWRDCVASRCLILSSMD